MLFYPQKRWITLWEKCLHDPQTRMNSGNALPCPEMAQIKFSMKTMVCEFGYSFAQAVPVVAWRLHELCITCAEAS